MLSHGFVVRDSFLLLALLSSLASCGVIDGSHNRQAIRLRDAPPKNASDSYAPISIKCPDEVLVRPAVGLSQGESTYIEKRRSVVRPALASWLEHVDPAFSTKNLPDIGLISSGGGYRAMLLGGGLVQALDNRESNSTTKGLYQAFLYHAGLSGGAWLLSSIAGNDDAPISKLKKLWLPALVENSLYPLHTLTSPDFPLVSKDVAAKNAAGFVPTLADPWGRFLAFQLFDGTKGGIAKTMSSIVKGSSFARATTPYPIITALGVPETDLSGPCDPRDNATQYEFTPHEFGSWDRGVKAFTRTETLGTVLSNGQAPASGSCVRGYDNLGYIIGTSSNKFQESCGTTTLAVVIGAMLSPITNAGHNRTSRDMYAPYANPFKNYAGSPSVSTSSELFLVDGGQGD
jgi:lysophospholipase